MSSKPIRRKLSRTTKKKPPSWKKLKRKLREKSEEDGPFQDGEYDGPEYDSNNLPEPEEPE